MKLVSTHHAMSLIKTYSGSWCTSRRFQGSSKLRCIFGCDARDEQGQYMYCQALWSLITIATDTSWRPHPVQRLGLSHISLCEMSKVLTAYTVYHEVKVGGKNIMINGTISNIKLRDKITLAMKALQWNTKAVARDDLHVLLRT